MKGILIEPGKAPAVTTLPDTLQGIEAILGGPSMQYTFTRVDRMICGPILCYGWKNNNLVPMSKDLQAEMLDRLKDTEVRV